MKDFPRPIHFATGRRLSLQEVWQYVKENYDTFLFKGLCTTLYRIIKKLGLAWRKGDPHIRNCETNEIIVKRLYFVADYMKNKRSENPKTVVYLEETWIYINGKRDLSKWLYYLCVKIMRQNYLFQ